ncbi:MAG: response regulator, partial [Oscillospiraceae bacterium]|jgi:CheY-like chemotaxis protein/HPt (histidine-containing phosphotransfer) domain-containing protein|nr:response regulator [Oscillospiraceae bacterium]
MSELLLKENLNKRQYRYATDIKTSAMALLDIINDILDVSKIQAGKLSLVRVHYDFGTMIDNISSMVHFLVEDKDLVFLLDLEDNLPRYLYGDDVRLRQVLLNLLGNAVKFTHKGYVRLAVETTDAAIHFTISDTGLGIHDEDIPRLFDIFEQVDTVKNRGTKGTGLGLSITKGLIEMMGGHISVESEYGKGTSFHFEIPKFLGNEMLISASDNEEISIYAPDARILVVDDNLINLNVAKGLLRLCYIKAETASSGKDAIKLIIQNQYDIVFMDYRMPEMSGVEATKVLRELGASAPIIALTASAVIGAKEVMLDSGMNDFLTKPIIKADLKNMLKKWIPASKLLSDPPEITALGYDDEESDTDEEFWRRIKQIEEISLSTGLHSVDDQRDVYKKTLRLMMENIDTSLVSLKELLDSEDMNNFRIEVHGIKGALASVGAMELSSKAFELESASGEDGVNADISFCAANLPPLLERLSSLSRKLKEAFASIAHSEKPIEIPLEMRPIFKRLTDAFEETDLLQIDNEMENLNAFDVSGPLKEEIEMLKDEVMLMEYYEATEHIAELLGTQE